MYATLILPGMYVLSWVFAFITFLDHFMSFYIAKGWSGHVQHLTRLQKVLSQFPYMRQAYSQGKMGTNVWLILSMNNENQSMSMLQQAQKIVCLLCAEKKCKKYKHLVFGGFSYKLA